MKTYTGKVLSQEIKKNRDGENDVRMLSVEITEPDDIQEIQQIFLSGEDNAPAPGDDVVILEISETYKIVIAIEDGVTPSVEVGERAMYSRDDNVVKAFVYLKNDGQMILNGDGDFAVRYNELETAFEVLRADLNDLVTTYNSHTHPTAPTGPVSVPSSLGIESFADITPSKIDSIEVPPASKFA